MTYKKAKKKPIVSKLAKNKANPYSRYWRNRADKLWRTVVGISGKCLFDGPDCSQKLDAHHLIPREYHPLRVRSINGVLLCYNHHKLSKECSAHKSSIRFADRLRNVDYNKYLACISHDFNILYRDKEFMVNWKEECSILEKELEQLKGKYEA